VTHGDPASNEDNTLIGADFLYRNTRIKGQTIEAEAWYQKTDSDGLEGDDAAWALSARLRNESKLRGRLIYKEFGENYNPALGFVSRTGVSNYIGQMGYMFRPKHDLVRDFYVGMDYILIEDTEGNLQTSAFGFNPLDIETHVGDEFSLRYERNREGLTEVFEIFPGVEIPAGDYSWDTYSLRVEGARQRMLSGWASISKGTDYNGDRWGLQGGLTWRPSKHFATEASYTYNDFDLPYGSFVTRLMSLETDIVFSDTLSWTTLVQYDNRSKDLGIHSRLHFIPEAGRDLYLVINHNFVDEDDGLSSTRSDIVLKINYTFRF